jgi:hypothetical protein
MGNRKQPTPLPTNQVRPEPPPPPPAKRCPHNIWARYVGETCVQRCVWCGEEWVVPDARRKFVPVPPKPPEPPIRVIKEGHIPPRTDGHVSWWRRLVSGKRSDGVNEDPRVKSARELYGVDAADYYKAKDREREAGRQFAINVAETVARLKRFVAQYQRSE